MSASAALEARIGIEDEVCRRDLGNGVAVVLLAARGERRFRIARLASDGEATVLETPHPEEATSVFDAYDGERGWHHAYPPRGATSDGFRALRTCDVHAVGATVEDCVKAFLDSKGESIRAGSLVQMDDGADPEFQWGCAFASEGTGTGFKAAGRAVPGGFVMTWWS